MFVECFKFFQQPTTKWRCFKFFAKLNGNHILMANFSTLRKNQTFGLIELHNLSNGDRIFKLLKSYVCDYQAVEHTNFEILTFYKKNPGFRIDFGNTDKILPLHQYLWSKISRGWISDPLIFLIFFKICTEECFAS